jgi:hypothetical protein
MPYDAVHDLLPSLVTGVVISSFVLLLFSPTFSSTANAVIVVVNGVASAAFRQLTLMPFPQSIHIARWHLLLW